MARNKIEIPQTYIATFHIPVRITDINYSNHLGNDSFVSLIHEARMQWLVQHGYSELNVEGKGLIMSDLAVDFKNESFYGDQLSIEISIGEITRVSFEIFYRLTSKRDEVTLVLALAKTTMVCFDYSIKKVAAIPEKWRGILTN